jgi:hypothetical protein
MSIRLWRAMRALFCLRPVVCSPILFWSATKEVDTFERQHEFSRLIEDFTPGCENTQFGSPL